jgi:hypothetical protein
MSVARTIDVPFRPSHSSRSTEPPDNTARAVLVAAAVALTLALLGWAHFAPGAGDGYPDPTQQWTD